MNAEYLAARDALAEKLRGLGTPPLVPMAVRVERCPHCNAAPYSPCVVVGYGSPMTKAGAHPARYTAAGEDCPRPVGVGKGADNEGAAAA